MMTDKLFNIFTHPRHLLLCEGCLVIVTTNVEDSDTLKNGTRGVVIKLTEEGTVIAVGAKSYTMKRHPFTIYSPSRDMDIAIQRQFPLLLAYACTEHHCQCLTLDDVVVHCATNMET